MFLRRDLGTRISSTDSVLTLRDGSVWKDLTYALLTLSRSFLILSIGVLNLWPSKNSPWGDVLQPSRDCTHSKRSKYSTSQHLEGKPHSKLMKMKIRMKIFLESLFIYLQGQTFIVILLPFPLPSPFSCGWLVWLPPCVTNIYHILVLFENGVEDAVFPLIPCPAAWIVGSSLTPWWMHPELMWHFCFAS